MRFKMLAGVFLAAVLAITACGGSSTSSGSSHGTATSGGCQLPKEPAGASATSIKAWVDPRPCNWAQKYPLFAPPATGDGSLQRVQKAGVVTICAEYDQPPGVYVAAGANSGQIIGYEPDILKELTKRLGIKSYKYVSTAFGAYIPSLQAHKCDVVMGVIGITSARAQAPGIKYTQPYLVEGDKVVVLKDSSYQKIADLKGQKIGAVPGSVEDIEAKQIAANLGGGTAVAEFPTDAIIYTALFNKQVAAVIDVSLALLQRPDADKLRQLNDPVPTQPDPPSPYNRLSVAAITSSSDSDLNTAFSIVLANMAQDGSLQKIFTANQSYLPGVLNFVRSDA